MTDSSLRLLAAMTLFPAIMIMALAVAIAG